jgi:hypothetical protein
MGARMNSEDEIPLPLKRMLVNYSADLLIGVKNLANHEEIPKTWREEIKIHFREINLRLRKFKGWDDKEPRPEVYAGMRWIRDHYDFLENVSASHPSIEIAAAINRISERLKVTPETIRNYLYAYQQFQKGDLASIEQGYLNALIRLQEEVEFDYIFDDSESGS